MTPSLYLDSQVDAAFNQLRQREQDMRRKMTTPSKFNQAFKPLQEQFTKFEAEAKNMQGQFAQWQQMVDAGMVNRAKAEQAMWQMILPKEMSQAMFPSAGQPFTPGQLTGSGDKAGEGGYLPSIEEFASAAEGKKTRWSPLPGDQTRRSAASLVKQYKGWRDYLGYDALDPFKQQQLDILWDDEMKADGRFKNWNPNAKEIKSLRSKGPFTKALGTRIAGSQTNAAAVQTPLMKSIQEAKPAAQQLPQGMVRVTLIDGTPAQMPAANVEAARAAGKIK
jgi:hypothetical protein